MNWMQTSFYCLGIFTFGTIFTFTFLCLCSYLRALGSRIAFRYYGKARVRELYAFMDYVRVNEIASVQKYAKSRNPLDAFLITRLALYLLRKEG
jgi:hypothetical protein